MVWPVGIRGAVEAIRARHIDFAAQNGLQPTLQRRVVELYGAEKVSVVRDGDGRHLELSRAIHQATDFTGPVEQAVVSMEMKMDEVFGWHPANILTETSGSWRADVQESEVKNNTFSRQQSATPPQVCNWMPIGDAFLPTRQGEIPRTKFSFRHPQRSSTSIALPDGSCRVVFPYPLPPVNSGPEIGSRED